MTDDTERITVGEEAENGEPVSMPVIDVLAGRGFITGKSGSGKSNTASVVAEQLLEAGYGLLIVDVDGEYYGLKEEYELLHAGADEECDIQVSPEHAEKLATLALEDNVPIILDVSSYLDTEAADEMLLAVARQLFAKAKKQKKPFLVLVEECHEYIPEGGGMTETGKMLIKIGKRGRKHGLGIVGMSQRPADVKKDFITQCDWMVWHRLTWDNDTRVVGRILGNSYADRVEDLGDGEAFLVTDWTDDVRRVQFDRKRTFDAGATPGLEEFERPELQSVSEDLVADLQQVSEERQRHESELSALEAQLEEKEQRIEELEAELAEARDMSEMADRFAQALVENAESSPPENAPAEPEVAEAEEFVADAARGGYPGDEPAPEVESQPSDPGAPETGDTTGIEAAEEASTATELLSEDQRELHDYERESEESADSAEDEPPESSECTGEEETEPVSADSGVADTEPEPADSGVADTEPEPADSGVADTEPESADSGEEATAPPDTDSETTDTEAPSETEEAESTSADPGETETSGLQPVKTISRGPAATNGEETEQSASTEDAESVEAGDEGAETEEATGEPTPSEDAVSTDADSGAGASAGDTAPSDEPESELTRTTIQATGGWPQTGDTDRAAEPDPDLEPASGTGAETPEELERQLSEEFGVVMETNSDLTGGSLGSSTGDGPSTPAAGGSETGDADQPDEEPESGDGETEPTVGETEPTDEETEPAKEAADTAADGADTEESDRSDESDDSAEPTEPEVQSDDETDAAEEEGAEPDSESAGQSDEGVVDPTADRGARLTELVEKPELRDEAGVVQAFVHGIEALDDVTRGMLEHYRQTGNDSPVAAHVAAGGSGERQYAYARNRTLRKAGLVEHVGGGRYRYRLPDLVAEAFDARIDEQTLADTVAAIEAATGIAER